MKKLFTKISQTVILVIATPFIWVAWKIHEPGGESLYLDESYFDED